MENLIVLMVVLLLRLIQKQVIYGFVQMDQMVMEKIKLICTMEQRGKNQMVFPILYGIKWMENQAFMLKNQQTDIKKMTYGFWQKILYLTDVCMIKEVL